MLLPRWDPACFCALNARKGSEDCKNRVDAVLAQHGTKPEQRLPALDPAETKAC